jgi:CubicO group peptidase (beta-lactamase class C family)
MTIRCLRENGEFIEKPALNPIRIVDLFTMSSGFSYDVPGAAEFLHDTGGNVPLGDLVSKLAERPINFEPGSHWCYGFSHDILGAVIEVVSGKSLGEFFSENIFMPLGMFDTGFKLPKDKHHRIVSCYAFDEVSKAHSKAMVPSGYLNCLSPLYLSDDWIHEMPGGGLISSVDDYAKFANTLCLGGTSADNYKLLGEATIDLMTTNHLDEARMLDYGGNWGHHSGYGYGLGVRTMVSRAVGGSSSSYGEFGWSGLAGTYVLMDPIMELCVVYAQQLFPSREEFIAARLRNIVYGCL